MGACAMCEVPTERECGPHARTQRLEFLHGISDYPQPDDIANEVAIHARPGDLLVHHAMTIHRAEGNRSRERSRRAIGFIYYDKRAKEDVVAKQAYQKRYAEEMKTAGKI